MRKYLLTTLAIVFLLGSVVGCQKKSNTTPPSQNGNRIISLNGALTEVLVELGYIEQLVGRDVTSTFPKKVKDSVKDLGHVRSLTIEPLMSLHPDLILATDGELASDLEKSIRDSGIEFKVFKPEYSIAGTKKLIDQVADFLDEKDRAEALKTKIDTDMAKLETFNHPPKVLFVYARGAGTLMVAGEDTQMTNMIEIAGGKNAVTEFKDFKPLTEEALLENNPDVVLLFDSGLQSLGGVDGFLKAVPAITQTQAGKDKAIISMDGGLLSDFGPRVGEAAYHLNQLLKPYAK